MTNVVRFGSFAGTALIVVGLGRYHAERNGYGLADSARFAWSIAYIGLLCLAAYGLGLPDLARGRRTAALAVVGAPSMAAVGISVVQLFVGDALLPRFVVFGTAVLVVPFYALCVVVASGTRALAEERDRVLVIGDEAEADILRYELANRPERPAQVVGSYTVDELQSAAVGGLVRVVDERRATVIVLCRDAQADEALIHQAAVLHERGVRLRTLALFHEEWLGKLPISELERVSLMFDIGEVHRAVYLRVARLLDILVSTMALPLFALSVPFVLAGNVVANRGPLFYRQRRVGKNGQLFQILKYRTMRPDDGRLVNEWTTEGDPRITPFGRILRVSHVDELPQVLNILRGQLSVVGPRPEQPHYVDELVVKIPFYNLRHLVRPGLTGWAQVKYGYAGNEGDALEKLQYEFFYLRHQNLWFDLRIIGRTVRSVLGRKGR